MRPVTGTIVAALIVLAALPSCSTPPPPTRGTISGTFVEAVGTIPVNGHTARPIPLPGRIVASSSGGQQAQVTTGRNGKFTLVLRPGTYQLAGYSPRFPPDHGLGQCGAGPVRVRAGAVLTHIQVICGGAQ